MEVISIDGVEYTKANQLAKRFKYTTDYIGQLCRADKVKAKLVGRTWYVNFESLSAHKNNRYLKSREGDSVEKQNLIHKISPRRVEATLRKNTFQLVAKQGGERREKQNFINHIAWKPAKYEADSADLFPQVKMRESSEKIIVDLAEAEVVEVSPQSRTSIFKVDALPEVSLRGKVKVTSALSNFDNNDENIARTDFFETTKPANDSNRTNDKTASRVDKIENKIVMKGLEKKTKKTEPYTYPVQIQTEEPIFANLASRPFVMARSRATPSQSQTNLQELTPKSIRNDEAKAKSWFWPFFIFLVGVALITAVALVEKNVSVSAGDYTTTFSVDFSLK